MDQKKNKSFSPRIKVIQKIYNSLMNPEASIEYPKNQYKKFIKDVVQSNSANNLSPKILYGGSVTDKNAESFFREKFVDGALIGGASLDGITFAKIVNIFNTTKKL